MKIYAYKTGSKSARALADALGIKIVKHEGKRLNMRGSTLINWGASGVARDIVNKTILNAPEAIARASNKLKTFELFKEHGVPSPEWTTDVDVAAEWVNQGFSAVQRNKLTGHSGEGIEIIEPAEGPGGLTKAPLYTKYVKKDQEYRIHVFRGEIIFQQRKARKKEVPDEEVNWKVRNLAGGFIFANVDVVAPDSVCRAALAAVDALGLDFGAVDVITNKKGEAFALEVNTACGLEGSTLEAYRKVFSQFV